MSAVEFYRSHLKEAGLSDRSLERIERSWRDEHPSSTFVDYLAVLGVLAPAQLRMAEAVRKGYVAGTGAAVLGRVVDPFAGEHQALGATDPERELDVETCTVEPSATTGGISRETDELVGPPASLSPPVEAAAESKEGPIATDMQPPRPPSFPRPASSLVDILRELPAHRSPLKASKKPRFPRLGETVGRYVLQERLGEGATAIIFRSFHAALGVPVAIKVFRPEVSGPELFSEARLLAKLDHPHIVRVLDVDESDGVTYIVFEFVGSMTLEDLIHASGRLPMERVLDLGIELASGLFAAQEQHILHRDVKPSNVLLRRDGRAKLVDFGLAMVRNGLHGPDGNTSCGSPAYMAPEQILSPADVDARTDMYGFGATLYHAAAGVPPFDKPTPAETLRAQLQEPVLPLHQRIAGFDEEASGLIRRLLEKNPQNRFPDWGVVLDRLVELRSDAAPSARPRSAKTMKTLKRAWSSLWHRSP